MRSRLWVECVTATRWKFVDDLEHGFGDYFRMADHSAIERPIQGSRVLRTKRSAVWVRALAALGVFGAGKLSGIPRGTFDVHFIRVQTQYWLAHAYFRILALV